MTDEPLNVGELIERSDGTSMVVDDSDINRQIATAKKWPRDEGKFLEVLLHLVDNEEVANECVYQLSRGNTRIVGPSVRMAELVLHSWGNTRVATRVVGIEEDAIITQTAAIDLERNNSVCEEVRRRIVDKHGNRYSSDMISQTAGAAGSIAIRNAIFRLVPRALWSVAYHKAQDIIQGRHKPLDQVVGGALKALGLVGVDEPLVLRYLGHKAVKQITHEDIVVLRALYNTIRDGGMTAADLAKEIEEKAQKTESKEPAKPSGKVPGKSVDEVLGKQEKPAAAPPPPADDGALDAKGLPWNERYHASSRSQNKDGTWRVRRGLSEQDVKDMEEWERQTFQAPIVDQDAPEEKQEEAPPEPEKAADPEPRSSPSRSAEEYETMLDDSQSLEELEFAMAAFRSDKGLTDDAKASLSEYALVVKEDCGW